MASFAVEIVALDDVLPHTNADSLELAVIGGYRAVVRKGQYRKGDLVGYIPEQAVVPEDILEHIGLSGRLSGRNKDRVKAIRLRGELSQGIVVSTGELTALIDAERTKVFVETYPEHIVLDGTTPSKDGVGWVAISLEEGMDLQFVLGIQKWEPPIPANLRGRATNRPSWFPVYDLENIKKYNRVLEDGEAVIFTEKIHGTNAGFAMRREDRQLLVASRRWLLEEDDRVLYWMAAKRYDMAAVLNALLDRTQAEYVIVFGEIFGSGVQDLNYGMQGGEIRLRYFDIVVDGEYLDYDDQISLMCKALFAVDVQSGSINPLSPVPVVYRGPFSMARVALHTDGNTTAMDTRQIREGIVIRPIKTRYSGNLGRVVLKSVSQAYLLREHGTEYN
jgi:RNA ligase (TIGR02306 family)